MTSATGTCDARLPGSAGFTLVELVVVMLIIGIASAAAVLALPGGGDEVRRSADRLAARTLAARDLAILSGRPVRLMADETGISAFIAGPQGWLPAPLPGPARTALPAGQQLHVEPAGALAFDVTGLATPARLVIRKGEAAAAVTIDAAGAVHAGPA
jgi:general secretion pathway protein H